MSTTAPRVAPASSLTLEGAVVAHSLVQAKAAALGQLRQETTSLGGPRIPPRFLHHADDQTVVALAAVLQAIRRHELQDRCFDEWGVLAAPRFPGRCAGAASLPKFHQEGPATTPPHLIAQHSLHSPSGAVSVALGMHGPNFGIGGGPGALVEGLLVALSLLDDLSVPGIWLVLTEWDPEIVPDENGRGTNEAAVCHAIAMALAPAGNHETRLRLTWPAAQSAQARQTAGPQAATQFPSVAAVAGALDLAALPTSGREGGPKLYLTMGCHLELVPARQGVAQAA